MPKPHPLSCGSRKCSSTTSPTSMAAMPRWTMSFGENRPVRAEPPRAKTNIADRHGQDRHPGLQRVEAQHRLQVEGQHEECGLDDERLTPLHHEPGAHPRDLQEREVEEWFVTLSLTFRSRRPNTTRKSAPIRISHSVGDSPSGVSGWPLICGTPGARRDPAPLAGAQDAEHDGPKAESGQHGAGGVELGLARLDRRDDPAGRAG